MGRLQRLYVFNNCQIAISRWDPLQGSDQSILQGRVYHRFRIFSLRWVEVELKFEVEGDLPYLCRRWART